MPIALSFWSAHPCCGKPVTPTLHAHGPEAEQKRMEPGSSGRALVTAGAADRCCYPQLDLKKRALLGKAVQVAHLITKGAVFPEQPFAPLGFQSAGIFFVGVEVLAGK